MEIEKGGSRHNNACTRPTINQGKQGARIEKGALSAESPSSM
jgi:hypothetical protein